MTDHLTRLEPNVTSNDMTPERVVRSRILSSYNLHINMPILSFVLDSL